MSCTKTRAIPGIAFQTLSLINTRTGQSWPLLIEQIAPKATSKKAASCQDKTQKRGRGRPKGSQNKNRREIKLNAEMSQVQRMLTQLLTCIGDTLSPVYFLYDGAFGNNAAVQMTRRVGLHLISKLRHDSNLYYQWTGDYSGLGRRRIYGHKIEYKNLPDSYLKSSETTDGIQTDIYQINARHKTFADPLNVVIICKKNLNTGKQSRLILFSSDLELNWESIIAYYPLRFQIEFNFRDAKQHWGLEDFNGD